MTIYAADVSYFQAPVDDSYDLPWLIFRCCDGDFMDPHCAANAAWAAGAPKLAGWTAYAVYRPGMAAPTLAHLATLPPGGVVMVDVESWGGAVRGDHSHEIMQLVDAIRAQSGVKSVWIYGNAYDLAEICPSRGNTPVVIAAYGNAKPVDPYLVGWQYTDGTDPSSGRRQSSPPFGPCDHNELYITATPVPEVATHQVEDDDMGWHFKYSGSHFVIAQGKMFAVTTVTPYVASLPDWGPVSKAQVDIWTAAFGPAVIH